MFIAVMCGCCTGLFTKWSGSSSSNQSSHSTQNLSFETSAIHIWVNFPRTGKMIKMWLKPELELFEVWEIVVLQIIITIIVNVINFKQL